MKKFKWIIVFACILATSLVRAQTTPSFKVPAVANPSKRMDLLKQQWDGLHKPIPQVGVRDCFLFLLDALDTKFLTQDELLWTINLVKTRVITDSTKPSYGNMYWGWTETGGDVGDGNNVEFCVQYGILIKFLYNDRMSENTRASLDDLFASALKGVHRQPVRISYTNIYVMRCLNLMALGQIYKDTHAMDEGKIAFDIWLKHIAHYGNREYDSPTYSGVDLESLLLMYQFIKDPVIHQKASDALDFFLTDLSAHYNPLGGYLAGAHSRDYNRVFGRDLLEEKYINPLLGKQNNNNQLFHQVCFSILKQHGLSKTQLALMNKSGRYIQQRWDSLAHTFASDYHGKKFSIASSNQYYSPDDKSFVMYLNSPRIKEMPNIVYTMEGRDDPYGVWASEGMGEKKKHMMPANYPANGGWGKTRHLMPFMQVAQNKNEFVMLVSGEKDHNCINDYLNSTIVLPNYFDEIWIGNKKVSVPKIGDAVSFDETKTFFARFEDVGIAIKILFDNADETQKATLFNDGFRYNSHREAFNLEHNAALRITLKHPNTGKGNIAMWWKMEEGIDSDAKFNKFRSAVLNTPVLMTFNQGLLDVKVQTSNGLLGLKTDLGKKFRVDYYNPQPIDTNLLFKVDGKDWGKSIMSKYR